MNLDALIVSRYQTVVPVGELAPFAHEQVFFNVNNAPKMVGVGSQPATPGSSITLPLTKTTHGQFVVFFTTSTDARLNRPYAGAALTEAIEIVSAMPAADGLTLQSQREPALVLGRASFGEVKYRDMGLAAK